MNFRDAFLLAGTSRVASHGRRLVIAASALSLLSCRPVVTFQEGEISEACLAGIAAAALQNPRTNPIAANFAGPLGLSPSSNPDDPPFLSKQVETPGPDGAMHYFAIGEAGWKKALLIRVVPEQPQPHSYFYTIDRAGKLTAAGEIRNLAFSMPDLDSPEVVAGFEAEQRIWLAAGPVRPCRHE